MIRTILAAALSAALALPTLTAPAAAHQTNYAHQHRSSNNGAAAAAVIGGLAAILLLKHQADKREERRAAPVRRNDVHRAPPRAHRNAKVLPGRCFNRYETRRGVVRGYGARCMQRTVGRPRTLPAQCITQVRTDRGVRNLYTARCMRRQGWTSRTARR